MQTSANLLHVSVMFTVGSQLHASVFEQEFVLLQIILFAANLLQIYSKHIKLVRAEIYFQSEPIAVVHLYWFTQNYKYTTTSSKLNPVKENMTDSAKQQQPISITGRKAKAMDDLRYGWVWIKISTCSIQTILQIIRIVESLKGIVDMGSG